jgi:hypothetical protein
MLGTTELAEWYSSPVESGGGDEVRFGAEAREFGGFIIHLLFDTLKNIALLGALSAIFFTAELLKKMGMRAEYLERLELLHFWSTYGALAWIALVFFAKLVKRGVK